ncbi:MAG: hypothetical protein LW711_05655 [Saprospiraceae bacterium]|nr:hypothetical protein [Saprospiraceae bacterium]
MKRRKAIQYVSSILGLAISSPTLSAMSRFSDLNLSLKYQPNLFLTAEQFHLLDGLTELIIPKKKSLKRWKVNQWPLGAHQMILIFGVC